MRIPIHLNSVLHFGPYAGQTIEQIMGHDIYYIELLNKEGYVLPTTAYQRYKSMIADIHNTFK